MNEVFQKFDGTYYDQKYFADKDGKTFHRPDGSIEKWGYRNPEGEWLGCESVVEAWKSLFNPRNMLDVGCGRGTFVAYARDIGIEAEGFDFSEWAINNHYPRCRREWLKVHDTTKPWPYPDKSFDLVTILDLMEHIHIDDIDFVINEIHRVAKKWIFLQIATVGGGSGNEIHERGYIIKKGESIPIELEACAVAGHVTVVTEGFWIQRFKRDGSIIRRNLVDDFCRTVPRDVIENWVLNTMIVIENVC